MNLNLNKRDCPVKIKLVPYGGGWTDVYADFGDGELYFIISDVLGDSFETFMKVLYHLYPENSDPEDTYDLLECKYGVCRHTENGYEVERIVDDTKEEELPCVIQDIPWKASFVWDEEGSCSKWTIERTPDLSTSFTIKISIDICRDEDKHYEYELKYQDVCYAVADACTKALKKHGFWGYHNSCYTPDMNVRYLLFLKSVGLGNMEARKLTYYDEKGQGETSDFEKEMELLLFDM